MSIKRKMLVSIGTFVLMPVILVSLFTYRESEKLIAQRIEQYQTSALQQRAWRVTRVLEDMIKATNAIALDPRVVDLLSTDAELTPERRYEVAQVLERLVTQIQSTILLYSNSYFTVLGFNGFMYTSWYPHGNSGAYSSWVSSEAYRNFVESDEVFEWYVPQKSYLGPDYPQSRYLITLMRKITVPGHDRVFGVLYLSIDERQFAVNHLTDEGEGNATVYLTDHSGAILSHPDPEMIGGTAIHTGLGVERELLGGVLSSSFGQAERGLVVGEAVVAPTSWSLRRLDHYQSLYGDMIQLRWRSLTLVGLSMILFSAVVITIVGRMTAPLARLKESMDSVEKEEFRTAVPVDRQDEIGALARSFNAMTERVRNLLERIRREKEIEEKLQLQVLRAQISPHFLFNTLNTIRWSARLSGVEHVAKMHEDLGRILEMSVRSSRDLIELRQELENLASYVNLQKARFDRKLKLESEIPDALLGCMVPQLMLLPLVENSVKHVLRSGKNSSLSVNIEGKRIAEHIVINVTDNGPGLTQEETEKLNKLISRQPQEWDNEHIGLLNVHKRIQLLFGQGYGVVFMPTQFGTRGTTIELRIPAITEGADGQDPHR